MKFYDVFPDLDTVRDERRFEGSIIVRGDDHGPCMICLDPTTYIDLLFEGYCCSEECNRQFWTEYQEAELRAGPIDLDWSEVFPSEFEMLAVNWKKEGF